MCHAVNLNLRDDGDGWRSKWGGYNKKARTGYYDNKNGQDWGKRNYHGYRSQTLGIGLVCSFFVLAGINNTLCNLTACTGIYRACIVNTPTDSIYEQGAPAPTMAAAFIWSMDKAS